MIPVYLRSRFSMKYLLTAVLGMALLTGCDRLSMTDAQHLERAKEFEKSGNVQSAIIELKSALQKNSGNGEARLFLGEMYVQTGQGKEAEIELNRAKEFGIEPRRSGVPMARALMLQGEYKRVLSELDPDTDADPASSAQLLVIRGQAQLALGQVANAKKSFDEALVRQPDFPDAVVGQAQTALAERNPDFAMSLVEQVLAKSPQHVAGLLLKADIERFLGKPDLALATYKKVLESSPNNVWALGNSAYLYIVAGQLDQATRNIDVLRKYPGQMATSNYLQGLVELKRKNYAAARDSAQKVLASAPDHLPSVMLAGAAEFALGSYGQAERFLRQVLSEAPNTLFARELLAETLLKAHRAQQAVDVLQPALGKSSDNAHLLTLAGEAYMQNREFVRSSDYFARAAALDPKDPAAKVKLGVSRLANGDAERAMNDLEAAIELDPSGYQADFVLILSRLRRGEYEQAMKAVDALEQKQPKNPLTYNLKAGVLIATKDIAGARVALEKALALEPSFVPAAMNLARLDVQEQHPDVARTRFTTILDKDKNNVEALVALANLVGATGGSQTEVLALLERARAADAKAIQPRLLIVQSTLTSDPKRAIAVAREASTIEPENPAVLDALGLAQIAAGEQGGALSTYNKLAELQPRSALARLRLASLLIDSNNLPGAERALRAALELKPDYLEAQAALVGVELRSGHPAEALRVAQQVQKQSPKLPSGYMLEGDVLMAQKMYLRAAATYEKAFAVSRNGAIATSIHAAYSAAGKPAEADAVLRRWIKDTPDDLDARAYLAAYALRTRQYRTAIEQYQYILDKQPQNVLILNDLAWVYGQINDPKALETAERAAGLKPDDPHIADTLGWLLVQNGQAQRGIDVLQKAAKTSPNVLELRLHLGQALLKAGDKNKARQEFEFVATSNGSVPQKNAATVALEAIDR